MKIVKKILVALLIILIAMQFYRPEKNLAEDGHTAAFLAETNPPQEVRALIKAACYDCHSNHTNYPWYNNIAPLSYWMAAHVADGKEELNYSEWATYSKKKKDHKLEEIGEMLEKGYMPLKEYKWLHEEARLTDVQRDQVMEWAKRARTLYDIAPEPQ
ncbi:heme-binding domain-containing protein [Flavobacteriaceae bacterium F89]|uniref:Heme-binding domain-containing protein n=1 Tax=Cerina litoralis TaxID=2874477 RepID=A0AAE3EV17_9FLAO|nr:heme-binding domain-containing protein [Cerina litoralis]MCG2460819.1 heme-binding domain-containing protein [Cerina litoralis]